jgi:hypothetical protein
MLAPKIRPLAGQRYTDTDLQRVLALLPDDEPFRVKAIEAAVQGTGLAKYRTFYLRSVTDAIRKRLVDRGWIVIAEAGTNNFRGHIYRKARA